MPSTIPTQPLPASSRMDADKAAEILESIVDKPIRDVWFMIDEGVLMLGFDHGKTVYITGKDLTLDHEAAN